MKTVAALKRRITLGTVLTLDKYTISGAERYHKFVNVPRTVVICQTNSFALKPIDNPAFPGAEPSYCDWPKKDEYTPDEDGDGFGVQHGHIYMHYRITDALSKLEAADG